MRSVTKSIIPHDSIREMARKAFPNCEVKNIQELTEGMYNSAYRITGSGALESGVILKAGPMDGVKTLTYEKDILKAEVQVYHLLSEKAVPMPKLLSADYSHSIVPCDYFFMSHVSGVLWKKADKDRLERSRASLMEELGRINSEIHSVTGPWFGYLKEDSRFQFATWYEAFSAMMTDILNDGRADGYKLPYSEIEQTVRDHKACLEQVTSPQLVDFDLWAGNVLLQEEGDGYVISGILDFERSFYGDPLADFTSAVMIFDDVSREPDFLRGYGASVVLDSLAQSRMNLYRLYMTIIMCVETYRYNRFYASAVKMHCMKKIRKLLRTLSS